MGTSRFSARQLRGRTLKYLPQVSFIRAAAGFCDNDAWVTTHWGDIGQKQWCINNADIRVPTFRALARCARLCSAVKTRLYTSSGDERGAPDLSLSSFPLTRAPGLICGTTESYQTTHVRIRFLLDTFCQYCPTPTKSLRSLILSQEFSEQTNSLWRRPEKIQKQARTLYREKSHLSWTNAHKQETSTTLHWRI